MEELSRGFSHTLVGGSARLGRELDASWEAMQRQVLADRPSGEGMAAVLGGPDAGRWWDAKSGRWRACTRLGLLAQSVSSAGRCWDGEAGRWRRPPAPYGQYRADELAAKGHRGGVDRHGTGGPRERGTSASARGR